MIDKTVILETVLKKLDSLPVGDYLDVRSYKRNRSIIIVKRSRDTYLLIQDGFEKSRVETKEEKLRPLLKKLFKTEFPRSQKLRVYTLRQWSEDHTAVMDRKKI